MFSGLDTKILIMNSLELFNRVSQNPIEYAKEWKKKKDKNVIGFLCTYTPEELIHAADALPFRIIESTDNIALADSHLQSYCCSLVRSNLESMLSVRLSLLDGTVFCSTCDSMQRLSDIWRLNSQIPIHLDLNLPVKMNSGIPLDYMVSIFRKFINDLEKALRSKISEDKINEAIILYNRIRKSLNEIYQLKSDYPEIISGKDLYAVIRSSMVMDRCNLAGYLDELINEAEQKKDSFQKMSKKRILLVGSVCIHPNIYSILEDAGAEVVWDDLCTGTRYFDGYIDEKKEPVTALAERYFYMKNCPVKHIGIDSRGKDILNSAKSHNIDGVVFLYLKFCDPHSFDYPYIKEFLDKDDIANTLIEIDENQRSDMQIRTRLESFIEMLNYG